MKKGIGISFFVVFHFFNPIDEINEEPSIFFDVIVYCNVNEWSEITLQLFLHAVCLITLVLKPLLISSVLSASGQQLS